MARKKHAEEHVNLERWLISYADFITLLFATFVVLYALSQIDLAKFKDLKISLAKAFSSSPTILQGDPGMLNKSNKVMDSGGQQDNQNLIPPILDAPYAKQEESNFEEAMKSLDSQNLNETNGIKTEVTEKGLVIKLLGGIVFESSTATIKKDFYKQLGKIGIILKNKFPNHLIRVEGHTDNLPINSPVYPSNWELSSARSASIIRYMMKNFGISKDRFSALGYADSRPAASNNTEAGRKENRRVEIIILRNNLLKTETVSKEFKQDLKKEIDKFKEVTKLEGNDSSTTSDAVKNLLKEGKSKGNVIILDNSDDAYKKDAQQILKEIKEKEQQAEDDSKARKQAFFNNVKKQF